MAWQDTVEQTVTGLGFDLVELERSAGGLLRVTIDWPWQAPVEGLEYRRLEVGSPGIDRPLKREIDYVRFEGQVVDLTLKAPIGATGTDVAANRKKFRGTLERAADGVQWQVVWSDAPEPKPGQRVSKKRAPVALQALAFTLADVQQARLAPIVNFKGRQAPGADAAPRDE